MGPEFFRSMKGDEEMTTQTVSIQRAVEILLAEDNLGDILLIKEVLKLSKFKVHLTVARDGAEAWSLLTQEPHFSGRREPDLILLDLNMPKLDGRELLGLVKEHPGLKHIPVLVLTSSHEDRDMTSSYERHANFYIVKPMDLDHFAIVVKYIEDFWLRNIQQDAGK